MSREGCALVTGGSRGIGAEVARGLAADGWAVGVNYARDEEGARRTVAAIEEDGGSAVALRADVSEDGAGDYLFEALEERHGPVLALVNNAGVRADGLALTMSDDEWGRVVETNLSAAFRLTRRALGRMVRARHGRIVNVASVMAERTDYGLAAYAASKAGVAGLTRTLALELGKFGITANYVLPGAIYTGMTRQNFDQDYIRQVWEKKAALRRLGQPLDIARGILFLASEDGGFVTGHGLVIDGGLTLRT